MAVARRLSFGRLRQNVYEVIRANSLSLCKFSILNMAFLLVLTLGLGGVGSLWFLAWGFGYYLFHFMFFRWFFAKKPPLLTLKFFDTLLPAVKVMFMVMLGLTVLAYFPYFPLLFGGTSETIKNVITLFIGDFMGESNAYNFMISLIMLVMAPVIIYRPLLGWVAAVLGRSGSFRNAFKHTSGYYKMFLKVCFVFYVLGGVLWLLDRGLDCHGILFAIGAAPLSILFNLFLAKTYEALFLD